jgi:hypothetical protein
MRGRCPEECIASVRNMKLAETSWGQRSWRRILRDSRAQKGLWRHTWMDGWIHHSEELHHTTNRMKYFHYKQAPLQCLSPNIQQAISATDTFFKSLRWNRSTALPVSSVILLLDLDCGVVYLYRPSAINSIMQVKFRFKIMVISKSQNKEKAQQMKRISHN